MRTVRLILLLLLIPIVAIFVSCGEEDADPYFRVSETSIELPSDGGFYDINVSSNAQWGLSYYDSYVNGAPSALAPIRVSPMIGSNDGQIRFSASANTIAEDIKQQFTFDAVLDDRYASETITVILKGKISASGGDNSDSDDDSDSSSDGDDNDNSGGGTSVSKPSAPRLTDVETAGNSAKIIWSKVSDATSYNVYRSNVNSSTGFSKIGSTVNNFYSDSNLKEGMNYYRVTAVNSAGESSMSDNAAVVEYHSGSGDDDSDSSSGGNNNDNSGGGSSASKPSSPTNVNAENYGNAYIPEIKITWNDVSNATSYNVYRSTSSSSGYSKIGSTTNTYYSDFNPKSGKNYYKVTAVNSAGESSMSSYAMYDNDTSSSLKPATPTVTVSGSSSSLRVSWSCSTGGYYGTPQKYEVHKRDPSTASYTLLTTTTSTSYTDSNPHPGINRYVIVAINSAGKSAAGHGYSDSVPLARPTSFSASKSGTYVSFSWSKVQSASGYQIFVSSSASSGYTILKEISGGSTTSKSVYYPASSGSKMYFKIRAYWEEEYGGSRIYSDYSSYKYVSF